jgi:integrase
MRAAEMSGERPVALAVIRLMLLTGFRISEAQGLQRNWLHADEDYVHFPDTKSDGQVRAMGPAAARLAASQPAHKGWPYVFPADAAKIEDVTPHTLRHTFGSVARDLGFSELTARRRARHALAAV